MHREFEKGISNMSLRLNCVPENCWINSWNLATSVGLQGVVNCVNMSYSKGFIIDGGRGEFVFLEVDPFQVGDAVKGSCWDAANVVSCRSEQFQSVSALRKQDF